MNYEQEPRHSKNRAYVAWMNAKARCYNPRHPSYHHYGGRGITVCERWRDSSWHFIEDMGQPGPGQTLDRIDNDGPYSPDNCRWTNRTTQAKNRRQPGLTSSVGIPKKGNRGRPRSGVGRFYRVYLKHEQDLYVEERGGEWFIQFLVDEHMATHST